MLLIQRHLPTSYILLIIGIVSADVLGVFEFIVTEEESDSEDTRRVR